MENECIMRVSILEITFANRRTRRRPGNGNKFGYYLKISYRFVSNEQNSRKLKHLRGYVFHDETADRLLIRRQADKEGRFFVISMEEHSYRIFPLLWKNKHSFRVWIIISRFSRFWIAQLGKETVSPLLLKITRVCVRGEQSHRSCTTRGMYF